MPFGYVHAGVVCHYLKLMKCIRDTTIRGIGCLSMSDKHMADEMLFRKPLMFYVIIEGSWFSSSDAKFKQYPTPLFFFT